MTDAIANWFIKQLAEGKKPYVIIEEFLGVDNEGLKKFIDHLREENQLKNDDITITRIKLLEG